MQILNCLLRVTFLSNICFVLLINYSQLFFFNSMQKLLTWWTFTVLVWHSNTKPLLWASFVNPVKTHRWCSGGRQRSRPCCERRWALWPATGGAGSASSGRRTRCTRSTCPPLGNKPKLTILTEGYYIIQRYECGESDWIYRKCVASSGAICSSDTEAATVHTHLSSVWTR